LARVMSKDSKLAFTYLLCIEVTEMIHFPCHVSVVYTWFLVLSFNERFVPIQWRIGTNL